MVKLLAPTGSVPVVEHTQLILEGVLLLLKSNITAGPGEGVAAAGLAKPAIAAARANAETRSKPIRMALRSRTKVCGNSSPPHPEVVTPKRLTDDSPNTG